MKNIYTLCFFTLLSTFSFGQLQHVYIHFIPKVAGNTLIKNTIVQDLAGVEMSIDFFNYYVSNLHILHDGGQDLDLSDSVFLVEIDTNVLDLGFLDISTVSQVNFGVGVPQALNHLDISQYPMNHPLSYQNPSMQWGWTAGYAHMIVDGFGDNNNDGTPDVAFQLHNLGDANYKNVALPTVATQTYSNQLDIYINCNLDEWIYSQNPGTVGTVHGSGAINSAVMMNIEHRAVFSSPLNAGIESKDLFKGTFTSINSNDNLTVIWSGVNDLSYFNLYDANGKLIETSKVNLNQSEYVFSDLSNGSYVFIPYTSNGDKLNELKVIK